MVKTAAMAATITPPDFAASNTAANSTAGVHQSGGPDARRSGPGRRPARLADRHRSMAARNMLGARERFDAVPFFWSQQHDLQLNYVGHAAKWDRVEIDGSLAAKDCTVTYRQSGRKLAVLTIGRDRDSLAAEIELEEMIAAGG